MELNERNSLVSQLPMSRASFERLVSLINATRCLTGRQQFPVPSQLAIFLFYLATSHRVDEIFATPASRLNRF